MVVLVAPFAIRLGHYAEVGTAVGAESLAVTRPLPVTVCPADLLGGAEV